MPYRLANVTRRNTGRVLLCDVREADWFTAIALYKHRRSGFYPRNIIAPARHSCNSFPALRFVARMKHSGIRERCCGDCRHGPGQPRSHLLHGLPATTCRDVPGRMSACHGAHGCAGAAVPASLLVKKWRGRLPFPSIGWLDPAQTASGAVGLITSRRWCYP